MHKRSAACDKMPLKAAIDRWMNPQRHDAIISSTVILLLIVLITGMVYGTGGIKYVYSHAMYLPILFAALAHAIRGGLAAALVAGLLLGPWMPLNTLTGEMQHPINWLFRLAALGAVGTTAGAAVQLLRDRLTHESWLATHDEPTGLGNITYLADICRRRREQYPDTDLHCVVIEASNLGKIVGSLGVDWADRVIQQLADTIRQESNNVIDMGRYQTSKIVVIGEFPDTAALEDHLLSFMHNGNTTCSDGTLTAFVELSGGAATLQAGPEPDLLGTLRRADGALDHAKSKGRTATIYTAAEDQLNQEAVRRVGQIKRALENDELRLYFHPKVCTKTLKTKALEALIRWEHPTEGMVPPALFIPYAENTSLINDLTDWVIQEALQWLRTWTDQGFDISVSANVSTRNLQAPSFCQNLRRHLDVYDADPARFELEILESAIMHEPEKILRQLADIRNLSVTLSIDDFGTGYSSLAYLSLLPASTLKIDQEFIRNLGEDDGAESIAKAAAGLARDFNMRTVAEGVETEAVLNRVTELGIDEAQGYYFSKPMPASEVTEWLTNSAWPAARTT